MKNRDKAENSERVANEAARLAHEAISEFIDKSDLLEHDSQKIGAFLCAATYFYKNALQHALSMDDREAVLMVGLFKTAIAEDIAQLMGRADA